jgi:hypothetical protein
MENVHQSHGIRDAIKKRPKHQGCSAAEKGEPHCSGVTHDSIEHPADAQNSEMAVQIVIAGIVRNHERISPRSHGGLDPDTKRSGSRLETDSLFFPGAPFLDIEIDETFVLPVTQVILRKDFNQFPGQFPYFLRGPQILIRRAKISDTESGATECAQFKDFSSEGISFE